MGDVDGQDLAARALGRHPGGAADQGAALGPAGEPDDDPLAGLPGGAYAVLGAVLLEVLVDPVGRPQQGQFAQGGQVAGPEVVGQRRVDLVRRVDVAVRHPAAQGLRGHVDQFDLVGAPHHFVGHGLALPYAGDGLHHVAERLQVLDVDGGDDVDPGGEQFLDVLPALGVPGAGHVGVGQFVHDGHGGAAGEHRVGVHLGEVGAAVCGPAARHLLQPVQQRFGPRAVVVLDESDDHVGAPLHPAVRFGEHGVGLADAGRRAEEDPQPAPPPLLLRSGHHALHCHRFPALVMRCGRGRASGLRMDRPGGRRAPGRRSASVPARHAGGRDRAGCRGPHSRRGARARAPLGAPRSAGGCRGAQGHVQLQHVHMLLAQESGAAALRVRGHQSPHRLHGQPVGPCHPRALDPRVPG